MNKNLVIISLKNGQLEQIYTDLDLEVVVIDNKNKTTIYGENLEVDVHHIPTYVMDTIAQEDRELVTACCAINNEEAMEFLNEIAEKAQDEDCRSCCCNEEETLRNVTL